MNHSIRNKFTLKRVTNGIHKGFTLIELLVVIAIIGILATIIVASFASAQERGRDSRRKADVDAIKKALELFKSDSVGGAFFPFGPEGAAAAELDASLQTNGYILSVPEDPSSSAIRYRYRGGLRNGGVCSGSTPPLATCDDYRITIELENDNDPQAGASQLRCPYVAYGPPGNLLPVYVAATTYAACPN